MENMGFSVQENYRKDMTLKEAEVTALSTLKEVMEEKVSHRLQHTSLLLTAMYLLHSCKNSLQA